MSCIPRIVHTDKQAEAVRPSHGCFDSRNLKGRNDYHRFPDKQTACNEPKAMGDSTFRMLMEKDGIDLQMTLYTMSTNQDGSLPFALYVLGRAK